MTHTSDIGKARPAQGKCRTERKIILENNASEQVVRVAAIYKQPCTPIIISGLASSTCSPFSPCTLVPYPTLLWSPRLRCITHFQQLVPALKRILRRLSIRCSRPRVLAECHLSTVSYLPKLGAKLMLLPRKPKYPRNFHHSSSIKALKCEDSEMQLARLRFRPRRHPCRQH